MSREEEVENDIEEEDNSTPAREPTTAEALTAQATLKDFFYRQGNGSRTETHSKPRHYTLPVSPTIEISEQS